MTKTRNRGHCLLISSDEVFISMKYTERRSGTGVDEQLQEALEEIVRTTLLGPK
jgi:hypothetical protein